jgi:hypothetical protein
MKPIGDESSGLACVVANVAGQTAHGEGGLEIRHGLRHFAAGAKVWVLPPQWGDGGEDVVVVGHHRGTRGRGLVRIVLPRRYLTGFRVQVAYSPAVTRELTRPLTELGFDRAPAAWRDHEHAAQAAQWWSDHPLEARFHADGRWTSIMVSDPPPLEITQDGRTYHLAHLNAYRAVYSAEPPPTEQAPPR